jgi:hypothetical protein
VIERRVEYKKEVAVFDWSRLKFLDEAGSNLAMTRLYGRAAKGERVIDSVPQNYGSNMTMLATLTLSGITAPMTINGAVDGDVFKVYVEQVLALFYHDKSLFCRILRLCHRALCGRDFLGDFNINALCQLRLNLFNFSFQMLLVITLVE